MPHEALAAFVVYGRGLEHLSRLNCDANVVNTLDSSTLNNAQHPLKDWIQDFTHNKPRTVIFTSGDDIEAKQLVIE